MALVEAFGWSSGKSRSPPCRSGTAAMVNQLSSTSKGPGRGGEKVRGNTPKVGGGRADQLWRLVADWLAMADRLLWSQSRLTGQRRRVNGVPLQRDQQRATASLFSHPLRRHSFATVLCTLITSTTSQNSPFSPPKSRVSSVRSPCPHASCNSLTQLRTEVGMAQSAFSADLIPAAVQQQLGSEFRVRTPACTP